MSCKLKTVPLHSKSAQVKGTVFFASTNQSSCSLKPLQTAAGVDLELSCGFFHDMLMIYRTGRVYPLLFFLFHSSSHDFDLLTCIEKGLIKSSLISKICLHFFLSVQNLYLFLAQPNCLVHLDLSGTDCTVDSVCIQHPRCSLSTHQHLISYFKAGFKPEKRQHRALNMNQLPHKNNVSSAESQDLWGQNKRNMSLLMNNTTAVLHEKHKTTLFHGFVYVLTVISVWI